MRVPSILEIGDLFATPKTVDGACAMLGRARDRVQSVAQRCAVLAAAANERHVAALKAAENHAVEAGAKAAEAERAHRVSARLSELTA